MSALMTLLPMFIGYVLASKVFKIDILSSLGCICGGMTSTPALGALMAMTRSEAEPLREGSACQTALITPCSRAAKGGVMRPGPWISAKMLP